MKINNKGMAFLSILFALVIMSILTSMYFSIQMSSESGVGGINSIERSKKSACALNKQTLKVYVSQWEIGHPGEEVTLEKMKETNINIPVCPSGGKYSIDEYGNIICSVHDAEPIEENKVNIP